MPSTGQRRRRRSPELPIEVASDGQMFRRDSPGAASLGDALEGGNLDDDVDS